jgi:hypothetical protein
MVKLLERDLLFADDLMALGAFDTLEYWSDSTTAHVDTTVMISDTVWMSVVAVSDNYGICSIVHLMTLDPEQQRVLYLIELYPDCNMDQGIENWYSQHKVLLDGTVDIAELLIGPEIEVNGVVGQAPPVLTALRRITVGEDGSFRDTGYLELEKWIGPMYTSDEVSEWGW